MFVTSSDDIAARNDIHTTKADPATLANPHDFDRDSKVISTDQLYAAAHHTNFSTGLKLITTTAAPTSLAAQAVSASEIDLTWVNEAPSTGTTIHVDRETLDSDGNIVTAYAEIGTADGAAAGYHDMTASENTSYSYLAWATHSGANSPNSNEATATSAYIAPSGLQPNVDGTPFSFSWVNNSGSSPAFYIERSDDLGNTYTIIDETNPGDTTYTDPSPLDGTNLYRVVAANTDGTISEASNSTSFTNPISPATDLGASAVSDSEIDISWTNNSMVADGITILRSVGDAGSFTSIATLTDPTTDTYNDTGLIAGTDYYYEIVTKQGTDSSTPSTPADDTTGPPVPTGFGMTVASPTEVDLAWAATSGASTYDIQRKATGGDWQDIQQITDGSTSFADTGLWDGVTYSYQIDASNNAGTSDVTDAETATTPQTVPFAPSSSQSSSVNAVALSSTSVQLTWVNHAYNETDFLVERSSSGFDNWTTCGTAQPGDDTFTDSNLTAATVYHYRVTARNSAGDGVSGDTANSSADGRQRPHGNRHHRDQHYPVVAAWLGNHRQPITEGW